MEIFDWAFLAMMAGQSDINSDAFAILRRQQGVIPANRTINLISAPRPGSLTVRPFRVQEGGFEGPAYEDGVDYDIVGQSVVFRNDVPDIVGREVMVAYFTYSDNVEVITFNSDRFPPSYYIVGDFEYRSASTGADSWAQLHILNARPQADLSLSLGEEVTSLDITFDALADGRGDMFHIVKIDEDFEVGGGGANGAEIGFEGEPTGE